MQLEDYNEYYINGSDHYLIPKDAFIELFYEMQSWKDDFIGLRDVEREHQKINGELRVELSSLRYELIEQRKYYKDKISKLSERLLDSGDRAYMVSIDDYSILEKQNLELKKKIDKTLEILSNSYINNDEDVYKAIDILKGEKK